VVEADAFDTGFRWREGLRAAFQDITVEAVLLFPGDLQSDSSEANREGWRQLVACAEAHVLAIGDYQCRDRFKSEFDRLWGLPVMQRLFPEEFERLATRGLAKLRSEFFVLGREVLDRFDASDTWAWGPDPTPQVLLSTLGHPDLRVEIIPLGQVEDDPTTREPLGQLRQVVRYVAELVCDRIRYERVKRPAPEQELAVYDQFRRVILPALYRAMLEALDENRAAL